VSRIFSRMLNKYTVTALFAVAVTIAVFGLFGGITQTGVRDIFVSISDSFFIVGVFVSGAGGLLWASGQGAFDMLSYSISLMFKPGAKDWKIKESLYDYKERKDKNRAEFKHILLVGVCFLIIGVYGTLITELIF